MKSIGKRALALLASSLFGTTLWLAIFIAIIVGFEHLPGRQIIRARRPFSTDQLGGLPLRTLRSLASFAVTGFDLYRSFKNLKPQRSLRKAAKDAKSAE